MIALLFCLEGDFQTKAQEGGISKNPELLSEETRDQTL
jgi:hypothetical protein